MRADVGFRRMMKTAIAVLLVSVALGTTGCGTMLVRGQDDFKGHIYPATVVDSCGFVDGCSSAQPGLALQSAVSLPFDALIDTLCLPFDVWNRVARENDD